MTYAVNPKYIIPGEYPLWTLNNHYGRNDPAYWSIKCPYCQKTHPRMVTLYWDEGDEYGQPAGIVERHCFVCDDKNLHVCIQPYAPFAVLSEHELEKEQSDGHTDDDREQDNCAEVRKTG